MENFQNGHALIFAAAPETEYGYIHHFLAENPNVLIVCADGGLYHAKKMNLTPDFMITDCDSAAEAEGTEVIKLKPEKDDTDTQACVREVIRRGCSKVTLVCGLGGRVDHMLANLSLLEEAQNLGGELTVLDAQNKIVLHGGGRQKFIMTENYHYFSIVPLDEILTGVFIKNAKYPLHDATVHRAGMITISNETDEKEVEISIKSGKALIIFSNDKKVFV